MKRIGMNWAIGIVLGGLLLAVGMPASAQVVDCGTLTAAEAAMDSDGDGLTNGGECVGLTLWEGSGGLDSDGVALTVDILPCDSEALEQDPPLRRACVDVNSRDAWVFLLHLGADSLVATIDNPFEFAETTGITVHVFSTSDPTLLPSDRVIAPGDQPPSGSPQKGVKITENGDPSNIFGVANWGTPQGIDDAFIFSHAIQAFVIENCTNGCTDTVSGLTGAGNITTRYLRRTLSHELLHDWRVEGVYDSKVDGYHAAASRKIGPLLMEPFVVVKRGKFKIGTVVEESSQAAVRLR